MTGPCFVDSNVLVYRHDRDEPTKCDRARALLALLWTHRAGRLSDQVLHEFYVVATRKLATRVPPELARAEVRQLSTWHPIASTMQLRETAWSLEDRFSLSWWDARIVAAAQEARCAVLLTENLQSGMRFDDVEVVNPFANDFDLTELGFG